MRTAGTTLILPVLLAWAGVPVARKHFIMPARDGQTCKESLDSGNLDRNDTDLMADRHMDGGQMGNRALSEYA